MAQTNDPQHLDQLNPEVGVTLEKTGEDTIKLDQAQPQFLQKKFTWIIPLLVVLTISCVSYLGWRQFSLPQPPTLKEVASPTPSDVAMLSPTPNPSQLVVSPSPRVCLSPFGQAPTYLAKGEISVLVVPVYFDDFKEEVVNHPQRTQIYLDSFAEINAYLKTIQLNLIGREELKLNFTLGNPNLSTITVNEFEGSVVRSRESLKKYFSDLDISKYDIVVVRALTKVATNTSGMNWYRNIWVNQTGDSTFHIPEDVEAIQTSNQSVIHAYRGIFTSLMLHEILHSFGMTDGIGARQNVFYNGDFYTGTQDLFSKGVGGDSRDVDAETGIFQEIGENVSKQIGWSDRNNNSIIDVEEMCGNY